MDIEQAGTGNPEQESGLVTPGEPGQLLPSAVRHCQIHCCKKQWISMVIQFMINVLRGSLSISVLIDKD